MTTLQQLKNPIDVLSAFVDNKDIDIDKILKDADLFKINICYEKYKASINKPTAKVIINYQDLIYKIGAYLKYGSYDIRKLSKEEQQELEIPFQVVDGCSDLTTNLSKQLKKVLNMIPEKHRLYALIAILLAIVGPWCYKAYLDANESSQDKAIVSKAVDKLSEQYSELVNLVQNSEKENLSNLKEIDAEVTYQGQTFSSDELKEISHKMFPKKKHEKKAKVLDGYFIVTQINIKHHYIIIEDDEGKVEKILYADDLISCMQDFRQQFKQAIDDEGKKFKIKAYYPEDNGKKGTMLLSEITPSD